MDFHITIYNTIFHYNIGEFTAKIFASGICQNQSDFIFYSGTPTKTNTKSSKSKRKDSIQLRKSLSSNIVSDELNMDELNVLATIQFNRVKMKELEHQSQNIIL